MEFRIFYLNQGIFILWKDTFYQGGGWFFSRIYLFLDRLAFSGVWPEKAGPLGFSQHRVVLPVRWGVGLLSGFFMGKADGLLFPPPGRL
jgi:hypothetical protein